MRYHESTKDIMQKLRSGERGATAIEYIVVLALILLAVIAAIVLVHVIRTT